MRNAGQTGVWLVTIVLLAGAKFSYDHLRQLAVWPLEVMASSAWRLLLAHFETPDFFRILLMGPLAATAVALLIGLGCRWGEPRRRTTEVRGAENHE